ncbi:DUF397 domain-containing protein [Streptomyces sp. H27-D2]|uniref:DUF397 domain-containing protein n=1 Tax=Streptomyces sp. H27-D2 TaxID=3046304 RepID=UPI002DBFD85F|nr:DUF397 domain-containing protein [Streptomyces sp. H27-D2]MEC4019608.1 DUF397 domain-containing protein [Streptomyces sp. H27-D2]
MTVQRTEPPAPELEWFKSSYSTGDGGECVEVAASTGAVHVRDSKHLAGPVLSVSPETWSGLVVLASAQPV